MKRSTPLQSVIDGIKAEYCEARAAMLARRWPSVFYLPLYRFRAQERQIFLVALFRMLHDFASCDRRATQIERVAIDDLFRYELHVSSSDYLLLLRASRSEPREPPEETYRRLFAKYPLMLNNAIEVLYVIGHADGSLEPEEHREIERIATLFGLTEAAIAEAGSSYFNRTESQHRWESLSASFRNRPQPSSDQTFTDQDEVAGEDRAPDPLASAYKVLGCSPTDNIATIKKSYRRLAFTWHPDHLKLRVQSQSELAQGTVMFQRVQEAYELISATRGN